METFDNNTAKFKQVIFDLLQTGKKEAEDQAIKLLREKYYNYIQNYNELALINHNQSEKGFICWQKTNFGNSYYFVSNIGRVLLVKTNMIPKTGKIYTDIFDNEDYECWIFPQSDETYCLDTNSFININPEHDRCKFNSSYPVYSMVAETWLVNEKKFYKTIKEYKDKVIDLHHIDGNNMNLHTDNLIYIPNGIHARVHVRN